MHLRWVNLPAASEDEIIDEHAPLPTPGQMRPVARRPRNFRAALLHGAKVVGALAGAIFGMWVLALSYHAYRTESRDAGSLVAGELSELPMHEGERPLIAVDVTQRRALDYFRATRGVLLVTDRRLVFLGLAPRDLLAPEAEPNAFDQREFPIDTATRVQAGRAIFGLRRGIVVDTRDGPVRYAVNLGGNEWERARRLVAIAQRKEMAMRDTARTHRLETEAAREAAARAVYHRVGPGDALAAIARGYATTPEALQQLNHLDGPRIRIGEILVVRRGR